MSDRAFQVDLSNCDREPIHIPGTVQPHGVLFVVGEPALTVTHVSENISGFFEIPADTVIGRTLADVLGEDAAARLSEALQYANLDAVNPVRLDIDDEHYDGIVHRHEGATFVELEPVADAAEAGAGRLLREALIGIQSADDLPSLCQSLVVEVQRLTGYERTLLYRFDEQGHGYVDAEVKEAELEAYLGLHYPASDIPRQARQLYEKNWLRIIPDARYTPARILPALTERNEDPLDLSFSVLRSVSPIHLEYMANMGVRASMSVSLIVRGQLWGLISCANHSGPRSVSFKHRSACEVLGRLASIQIAALEDRHLAMQRAARRDTIENLSRAMHKASLSEDVLDTLIARPDALLQLVGAEGVAAIIGERLAKCGRTPDEEWITKLSAWLDGKQESVFTTHSLAAEFPDAPEDSASGLLSLVLPGAPRRRLLFFRPELVKTVHWGGDPNKPAQAAPGERLHPRLSFELWKEEVRLQSARWTPSDIEAADELRRHIIETDLERQVQKEHQAVQARDDLLAVVSHDLKNPLSIIQMQATLLVMTVDSVVAGPVRRVRACADRIRRSVDQMDSLILNLHDLGRIEAGRFSINVRPENTEDMIREALLTLGSLAESRGIKVKKENINPLPVIADRDRFFQVLSNLIGNAVKFTPKGGWISISAEEVNEEAVISVADNGSGIAAEELPEIFDRYWRGRKQGSARGSGLGLFIVKGIVEAHGGRVWAESSADAGTTVCFTLPRPSPED